jgi:hypothetical protein
VKIKGKKIPPPSPVKIILFREDGPIVLTAQAILDTSEFDKLCPLPKAPLIMVPGKPNQTDQNDPEYKETLFQHIKKRQAWEIITSLGATEGLEWEIVNPQDPETWLKYEEDLKGCFTEEEIGRILLGTMEANNPTERTQKDAFNSFSPTQAPVEDQSRTQKEEQESTSSGELANA